MSRRLKLWTGLLLSIAAFAFGLFCLYVGSPGAVEEGHDLGEWQRLWLALSLTEIIASAVVALAMTDGLADCFFHGDH